MNETRQNIDSTNAVRSGREVTSTNTLLEKPPMEIRFIDRIDEDDVFEIKKPIIKLEEFLEGLDRVD